MGSNVNATCLHAVVQRFGTQACGSCGSIMTFTQRRGSSEGVWICPVCDVSKRTTPRQTDSGQAAEKEKTMKGNRDR